jgi:ABC-type bacteriocin/lantibiotic exporter with double-glycine peptidase domain
MTTLTKLLSLLTPKERKRGLLVLFMVCGMALLEVLGVASVVPFLAVLGNPQLLDSHDTIRSVYHFSERMGVRTVDHFLVLLGLGSFVAIIVSTLFRIATHLIMDHFIEMRRHSISKRLLETYLRQPYHFYLNRHSGELSKTVLSEVDQLITDIVRPTILMVAYLAVVVGLCVLILIIDPLLAFVFAIAIGGPYAIIFLTLRSYLQRVGQSRISANEQRFTAATEAFGGIKEIKLSGCEKAYLVRFSKPSTHYAHVQASVHTLNIAPSYLVEAVAFGGILLMTLGLLIFYGGVRSDALGQLIPVLGVYALAAVRLKPAARHVFQGVARLKYGTAAVDNIYKDLEHRSRLAVIPSSDPPCLNLRYQIELDHVSFTYEGASAPALEEIALTIPVGSVVGLVGTTGAGKTTLVDIILGLLSPSEGRILIDGIAIDSQKIRSWQASIGYVPQEIYLTDTSIAQNIAFGVHPDELDMEQVVRCSKMANLHPFVDSQLADGYGTIVGERGVRLSGGQRQRIGIARALYRNPEVLVFDEATSALDSITEKSVMDAIHSLAGRKTVIMIAHRLSTVRRCDKLALLDHGRIVAQGTFSDLLRENVQFEKMASADT